MFFCGVKNNCAIQRDLLRKFVQETGTKMADEAADSVSEKCQQKVEKTEIEVATVMILSLRESLKKCQDELKEAKDESRKWRLSFQN
ncbi:hypothetical protein CDL12_07891 [Handroanthus impetiginosus]|uniref:Uncharacterized protein n=1 Tax=Handroanthus impetiginosus TaxID=429701 RepID=A0A2G9HQ64_9LAMI|nr:hypothetical protein CDL12_07891 [Handroanthus impetiginosus]